MVAAVKVIVWLGEGHYQMGGMTSTLVENGLYPLISVTPLALSFLSHSVSPLSHESRKPSKSSQPPPPSLLSLPSHPPSLTPPAATTSSLTAMTAGLQHLTGDNTVEEDEDEDYDA